MIVEINRSQTRHGDKKLAEKGETGDGVGGGTSGIFGKKKITNHKRTQTSAKRIGENWHSIIDFEF